MKRLGLAALLGLSISGICFASDADVALLKEIVEINSGSRNIDGVKKVQARLDEELKKLGFSTASTENPLGADKSAPLLVGTLKGARADRFVTLIVHADTVFEPEMEFTKFERSADGKQLIGPGVGDDKGGIVIALSGLKKYLQAHPKPPLSLRFVSTPNEEVGSEGFAETFRGFAKDTAIALGFEDAPANGAIARSRSGIEKYDITVKGKEAHAGSNHQDGANACVELSLKLVELSKLTDYKKGTTVNVGAMRGGSPKTNIVCGSADAQVEARTMTPGEMLRVEKAFEKILKAVHVRSARDGSATVTEFKVRKGRGSFTYFPVSAPYLAKYREILGRVEGARIESEHMAGSADIAFFSSFGGPSVAAIDSLGAIGGAPHTKGEHILASSLDTRAQAFAEFLSWYFEQPVK